MPDQPDRLAGGDLEVDVPQGLERLGRAVAHPQERSLRLVARPVPRKLLPTPRARMAISPPTQSSSAKSADSRW